MRDRPLILGIAGGSGSGKSTVVKRMVQALGDDVVSVIHHDWYYRDLAHIPYEERTRVNFDHPDSLETELLTRHLALLTAGHSIEAPTYEFASHTRAQATRTIHPTPLVILDGILVLAHPELREVIDFAVYVDTAPDVRLIRRVRRDTVERGRSPESVLNQYERTVRPMHLEFVAPSRDHADMIVTEGGYNEVAVSELLSKLKAKLAKPE